MINTRRRSLPPLPPPPPSVVLRLRFCAAYLVRYRVVFVATGVGCVINGGDGGEGRCADTTDRFLADLRTSTADIFVQRSRTL